MEQIPDWIDLIEVRYVKDRERWEARLIGDRITAAWMKYATHKGRDSIEGSGSTPTEAIHNALKDPTAYLEGWDQIQEARHRE